MASTQIKQRKETNQKKIVRQQAIKLPFTQ